MRSEMRIRLERNPPSIAKQEKKEES